MNSNYKRRKYTIAVLILSVTIWATLATFKKTTRQELQQNVTIVEVALDDVFLIPETTPPPTPKPATPKPTTAPRKALVNTGGVEQWRSVVERHDWPVEEALTIMKCESGGNQKSHNLNHKTKDDSWGLFQINLYGSNAKNRPSSTWLAVGENSISYAYDLYKSQGRRFGTTGGWYNCAKKFGIK